MSTRNVVLTDRHQQIIDSLVKSGRYQNASEVMREGLRLVENREAIEAVKLTALRRAARTGLADLEADRFVEVDADGVSELVAALADPTSASKNRASRKP